MRFYLLFLILIIASCKKDKEPVPPDISITAPSDGTSFTAGDTITVDGSVLSVENLESVTINFLDKNMTGVLPAVPVTVSGKSVVFSEKVITRNSLVAGDYFVQVVATSSGEQTRKYVKVTLNSKTGTNKLYLVFTGNQVSSALYKVDSSYQSTFQRSFSGRYYASSLFGSAPYLGISFYNYDLNVIDVSSNSIKWSLPRYNSPDQTFKGVTGSSDLLYVTHAQDGFVRAYDADKVAKYTAYTSGTYKPENVYIQDNYLLIDESPVVTNDLRKLSLKYLLTGAGYQESTSGVDIVSLIQRTTNEYYVFGNSLSQGMMKIYNVGSNALSTIQLMSGVPVINAEKVNSDDLVILTSQEILTYRYSINSMVPYLSISASVIRYDSDRDELLVAAGNELRIYNYTSKQLKRTVTFSDTVLDILITSL